jgi:hypothetical protein
MWKQLKPIDTTQFILDVDIISDAMLLYIAVY